MPKILLLLLFSLFILNSFSNDTINNKEKNYNDGDCLYCKNKIILALNSYNEELEKAELLNDTNNIYEGCMKIGMLYEKINDYYKAEKFYLKAFEIAKTQGNLTNLGILYTNLGQIYFYDNNYNKSLEFFNKSLKIELKLDDLRGVSACYNNIGEVYRVKSKPNKAIEYYKKSLEINKSLKDFTILSAIYENIGMIYHNNGELDIALQSYNTALNYAKSNHCNTDMATILNKMGRLYFDKYDYSKALEYLKQADEKVNSISSPLIKKDIAKNLSDVYYSMGEYKNAFNYFQIYYFNDEKIKKINKNKKIDFFDTKYKLLEISKQNELLEKQNELNRIFIYFIITFILLVSIIVYYFGKRVISKYIKIKKDKIEIENSVNNLSLKKNELEVNLQEKDKELTDFALYIIHKNNLMIKIKKELKKIKSDEKSNSKILRNIFLRINQSQKLSNKLYEDKIENANKIFLSNLNKRYPSLSANDKRLAMLLRIDLSSKEIASLNNISIKAVEMGRYRLRKRINLDSNINLNEFIKSI